MPLPLNWNTAALRNAAVMITVAGMPRFSNSTVSCTLHNVQDPHPPTAAIATCTSFAIWLMIAGSAGLE
jgi:hypothetical protein